MEALSSPSNNRSHPEKSEAGVSPELRDDATTKAIAHVRGVIQELVDDGHLKNVPDLEAAQLLYIGQLAARVAEDGPNDVAQASRDRDAIYLLIQEARQSIGT
jgi:hypothetical protein